MRTSTTLFFSGLAALTGLAVGAERTVPIYIQPVTVSPPAPVLLGEVVYDAALLAGADPASAAKVTSFEYPSDLLSPENEDDGDETRQRAEVPRHVRVGAWDPAAKAWASSTSMASTANFDKGFAPHFVVTVDSSGIGSTAGSGDVVGVVLKGVRIDAGQTRDFGPQVVLRTAEPGSQIELNKPVVLSPEGRKVAEEPEKTLLQKYVLLPVIPHPLLRLLTPMSLQTFLDVQLLILVLQVLVDNWYRNHAYADWWWRRWKVSHLRGKGEISSPRRDGLPVKPDRPNQADIGNRTNCAIPVFCLGIESTRL